MGNTIEYNLEEMEQIRLDNYTRGALDDLLSAQILLLRQQAKGKTELSVKSVLEDLNYIEMGFKTMRLDNFIEYNLERVLGFEQLAAEGKKEGCDKPTQ